MEVKHVWTTPSAEDLVAYMARVSSEVQDNKATAAKLIKYLITNKHWSPLDMVDTCVEINTTRDIARQVLRHRSFYFQEFSQRYASIDILDAAPLRELRLQDVKNRQNSIKSHDDYLQSWWAHAQGQVESVSHTVYQEALSRGIAKEQARVVLPEGLTPSRMYMKGTLRNWLHYINVRTDVSTQQEHREVAEECKKIIFTNYPSISELYEQASKTTGSTST